MSSSELAGVVTRSWNGDNLNGCFGIEFVSVRDGRATVRMPHSNAASQPTGLFHAGAIIALADIAATAAAFSAIAPDTDQSSAPMPLAFQISTNLIGNAGHGMLVAEAEVQSCGRTVIVAQTRVTHEEAGLVAIVSVTLRRPPSPQL